MLDTNKLTVRRTANLQRLISKGMKPDKRRNDAPATPEGAVIRGHQIVIKIWDNFAR